VLIELPAPARPHVSWCHSRALMPQRRGKRRDDGLRAVAASFDKRPIGMASIGPLGRRLFFSGHHLSGFPRTPVTSVDGNGPSGTKFVLYTAAGRLIWPDGRYLAGGAATLPIKCTCISSEAQIHHTSQKTSSKKTASLDLWSVITFAPRGKRNRRAPFFFPQSTRLLLLVNAQISNDRLGRG
jgi:hypothetical protein